jgi:regulatory protein YycH of two-component signal transduction system YycFG
MKKIKQKTKGILLKWRDIVLFIALTLAIWSFVSMREVNSNVKSLEREMKTSIQSLERVQDNIIEGVLFKNHDK